MTRRQSCPQGVGGARHDDAHVLSPAQAPSGPPRTLQPRDLFTDRATDDAVVVSMRTKSVNIKSTKAGQP
jgi:hypothetical protein